MIKMKIITWFKRVFLFLLFLVISAIGLLTYRTHQTVQRVKSFRAQVTAATKEQNIGEYTDLVYAIIYTESKGKTVDLMQSSESLYGRTEAITTTEESIQVGVQFLAEAIQRAKDADCDIWTAVQAYNFGLDYISFVENRGKKNSVALAQEYSRDVLAPILGNTTQATYHYYRWQSIFYNGGFLYENGGNMFYAELVKTHIFFVKWLG